MAPRSPKEEAQVGVVTMTDHSLVELTEVAPSETEPVATPEREWRWTRRSTALTLLAFGAFLLGFVAFELVVSGLVTDRSQRALLEEFRVSSSQGAATTTDWQPQPGEPVAILTIPRLGIDLVVVEGTTSSITAEGPGHFRGSALPGRPGTSIIAGRRTTFGAPFSDMALLEKGDLISFSTGVGQFTYVVQRPATRIEPGDPDVFTGGGVEPRLTLITSDPAFSASGRLAVRARLRGLPAPEPLRPVTLIEPSELGLSGDASAVPGLVVWGELLVLSCVATMLVRKRISRRLAWLLGLPLVMALTWATYLALNRVLPATL